MTSFNDTVMSKKAAIAESIVDQCLQRRGRFIPYKPVYKKRSHPIDRLLLHVDGTSIAYLDTKALTARNSKEAFRDTGYPDTGISIAHCHTYRRIRTGLKCPVFLAFVDEALEEVYGNWLAELEKPTIILHRGATIEYPKIEGNFSAIGGEIIYFPLQNMIRELYLLSPDDLASLRQYNNYVYRKDMSHKKGFQEWIEDKTP